MEIETAPLSLVKLNDHNPRQIKNDKFDRLVDSLLVFPGMMDLRPVIVDADFVALGGNMRTRALNFIKTLDIDAILARLDNCADYGKLHDDERDTLARYWSAWIAEPTARIIRADRLTEAERRQFIIKDNAAFGSWDFDALANEWEDCPLQDWGVDVWDTTPADVGVIPNAGDVPGTTDQVETTEDDFDETKDAIAVRCHPGDVWQLGPHRLMCGDSISLDDVNKILGGATADMVFTDPPYGYEYKSGKRDKFDVIKNDDKILDFFPSIKGNCNGFVFVCASWKNIETWVSLFKQYFEMTNLLVWDKGAGGMGDLKKTFSTDYELILVAHNGNDLTGARIGSVWSVKIDNPQTYIHPTQKPVGLAAMAIQNTTHPGATVLDLFGGSGSTLIACEQTGRVCRMMELDPHYCDVILARWEKLTGQTAVLL